MASPVRPLRQSTSEYPSPLKSPVPDTCQVTGTPVASEAFLRILRPFISQRVRSPALVLLKRISEMSSPLASKPRARRTTLNTVPTALTPPKTVVPYSAPSLPWTRPPLGSAPSELGPYWLLSGKALNVWTVVNVPEVVILNTVPVLLAPPLAAVP